MSPAMCRRAALCVALCLTARSPLAAQDSVGGGREGSSLALTAGRLILDGSSFRSGLEQVTVRLASLRPHRIWYDLGAGVIVGEGVVGLTLEAGPTYTLPLGRTTLLLRAGGSGLVAGGGGAVGAYGGLGVLVPVAPRLAIRLDLTRHEFLGTGGTLGGWHLGGGIALLPRIR